MSNKDIANERGLTPNKDTGTYYDESGNEYRDENGECLVVEYERCNRCGDDEDSTTVNGLCDQCAKELYR